MAIWQPRGFPVLQKLTDGIPSFPGDFPQAKRTMVLLFCSWVGAVSSYSTNDWNVGHSFHSQKEFVDNVKICEPLGCSDHNQIYVIIKTNGEQNRKTRYRKRFNKGRYKDMRKYLANKDWNNTLENKTATEC